MIENPTLIIILIVLIVVAPILILSLEFLIGNWIYVGVVAAAIVVYFIASKFIFKRGDSGGKAFHNLP